MLTLDELIAEATALPDADKAILIDKLTASMDEQCTAPKTATIPPATLTKLRGFLVLSLFLYGIALALPCLLFNVVPTDSVGVSPSDPNDVYAMKGIELTFFGIIGLLFLQIPAIGWFANPLYWLCCITFIMQRYRFSAIAGIAAVLIGFGGTFSAFWFKLPADSGGVSEFALNQLLLGFWLWLAAPGLIALVSIIGLLKQPARLSTRSD
ncbi:hypothetical protein [Coleofasciculus chthonoplastes]|uniref:hypothetical protein n=1 Tax=Coleofasciculus chthonoplastes TaxID=64178 RepID=UPI0032F120B6